MFDQALEVATAGLAGHALSSQGRGDDLYTNCVTEYLSTAKLLLQYYNCYTSCSLERQCMLCGDHAYSMSYGTLA